MYLFNSNAGISSTLLSSFLVPKKLCKSFTSCCVFCNVASGLEVIFLVHLQSFASKIFFDQQTGETTSNLFPFVWETWIILTRNRLLVDIFLTRRLSKPLAFCEFASVNFEPWPLFSCSAMKLSSEPTATNLSDILKIKGRLASFRAQDDVACCTITFHQ